MTVDLRELILTDYADEEFEELIDRINRERQRRIGEKRRRLYDNFINAAKALREELPHDEIWVSVYDEDVGEIDIDILETIMDSLDKFHKAKNSCT